MTAAGSEALGLAQPPGAALAEVGSAVRDAVRAAGGFCFREFPTKTGPFLTGGKKLMLWLLELGTPPPPFLPAQMGLASKKSNKPRDTHMEPLWNPLELAGRRGESLVATSFARFTRSSHGHEESNFVTEFGSLGPFRGLSFLGGGARQRAFSDPLRVSSQFGW